MYFKAKTVIGTKADGSGFYFPLDTTIVSDYGYSQELIQNFQKKATGLIKVCDLHRHEYESLLYTLYKCKLVEKKYKLIFEKVLYELGKQYQQTSTT
ncbi:hypothetical protein Barb7_00274 [Bacteroidales bacterium Barb7]|nr:hypothetical protein Barb7_00274 [Bacteroidales bacterium Barb7]